MTARSSAGCHVWQAGLYLSQWILNNRAVVEGKRCLELGCGTGLVGVSLVRSGARQVLLTDGNEEAVSNCCHNIEFNYRSVSTATGARCRSSGDPVSASVAPDAGPAPHVTVEVLGWGSRLSLIHI